MYFRTFLFAAFLFPSMAASPAQAATLEFEAPPARLSDGQTQNIPRSALNAGARRAAEILAAALRDTASYGGIEDVLGSVLTEDPDNELARALVAIARALAGDLQGARDAYGDDPARPLFGGEDAVARAMIARGAGDLAQAARDLRQALQIAPENAYAHNLLGSLEYQQNGPAVALPHFQSAVRFGPDGATYWANLGAVLAETGDSLGARAALRRAIGLAPGTCPTLIGLARLEQSLGQAVLAAQRYDTCLASEAGNQTAALGRVVALIKADQLEAAQAALDIHRDAIGDPTLLALEIGLRQGDRTRVDATLGQGGVADRPDVAVYVARRALLDGDIAAAQRAFASTDGAQSNGAAVRAGAAAVQLAQGGRLTTRATGGADPTVDAFFAGLSALVGPAEERTDPVAAFAAAQDVLPGLRIDGLGSRDLITDLPPDVASKLAVPMYLLLTTTRGAAPAQLGALSQSHPQSALVAYLAAYATVLEGTGTVAERIALLDRAIARAPDFFAAYVLRAETLLTAGRAAEALPAMQRALEIVPAPSVALRSGALAEALGYDTYAEAAYRQVVAAQPNSYIALNQLAWFLASRDRNMEEASDLATRAAELQPGNAAIEDTLGWIAYKQGDVPTALGHLETAVAAANGRAPDIVLNLAEVQLAAGNPQAALQALDTVREVVADTSLEARLQALADQARLALD